MGCVPIEKYFYDVIVINSRNNKTIQQTNEIRESKTFTQSTVSNPHQQILLENERHCSSKQIILKTLRKKNFNRVKSIKSFMKHNISKNDLERNVNSIENQKEKEQLISIISEWKHFTFGKFEKITNQNDEDINAHQLDNNGNNIFIHRIYDLNSQKSDQSIDKDDEDESCNAFNVFKCRSAEEKPITDNSLYQNAFSSIMNNAFNENLRLSIIKEERYNYKEIINNVLLCNNIYTTKKKLFTLCLKQIMLLCYRYNQIKAESQKNYCFALKQINLTDFKRKMNFFDCESHEKIEEFKKMMLLSHINTNTTEIEFSTINYIGNKIITNHKGMTIGKYTIDNEITKGKYWILYCCIDSITKEEYYIKVIMKNSVDYNKEEHFFDLFMLIKCASRNIAQVSEVMESDNYQYIILKLEESNNDIQTVTSFEDYINIDKQLFSLDCKIAMARNLITIAEYCWNILKIKDIDLSSTNLLFDMTGNLWLCAFKKNMIIDNSTICELSIESLINSLTYLILGNTSFDPNSSLETHQNSQLYQFLNDLHKKEISFTEIKNHNFITSEGTYDLTNIYDYALDENNRIVNHQIQKAKLIEI